MKLFCPECREEVEPIIKDEMAKDAMKGKTYIYPVKNAYCPKCHGLLWHPELHDENLEALNTVYRKENGIISLEKVREIPKKYNIGKRPLSLLLGWGEQTYMRFAEGDIPSKEYSQMLEKIYDSPAFFARLLEENKGNLKSKKAYFKSREAVSKLLKEQLSDEKRYEIFKMLWMINHGYTLDDLIESFGTYLLDCDHDESYANLFKEWELNSGFNGSIWPCFEEFLETEDKEINWSIFESSSRQS